MPDTNADWKIGQEEDRNEAAQSYLNVRLVGAA